MTVRVKVAGIVAWYDERQIQIGETEGFGIDFFLDLPISEARNATYQWQPTDDQWATAYLAMRPSEVIGAIGEFGLRIRVVRASSGAQVDDQIYAFQIYDPIPTDEAVLCTTYNWRVSDTVTGSAKFTYRLIEG